MSIILDIWSYVDWSLPRDLTTYEEGEGITDIQK